MGCGASHACRAASPGQAVPKQVASPKHGGSDDAALAALAAKPWATALFLDPYRDDTSPTSRADSQEAITDAMRLKGFGCSRVVNASESRSPKQVASPRKSRAKHADSDEAAALAFATLAAKPWATEQFLDPTYRADSREAIADALRLRRFGCSRVVKSLDARSPGSSFPGQSTLVSSPVAVGGGDAWVWMTAF
eukprot:CAMPEP_0180132162 /NCGR_PEP_ID=MMETSP0986-20121125/8831_1 /TAXON_ID=697907 /ORGANISM="non described non described, Strain CCMP2293" /LENGTH=193 /DNA_ID=CAMNT_0022072137 /DNA_START=32 /DNA_END=613 /DNA_ORIENTATION=+